LNLKTLWKHRICLKLEATKGATYLGLVINHFVSKFPSVTDMRYNLTVYINRIFHCRLQFERYSTLLLIVGQDGFCKPISSRRFIVFNHSFNIYSTKLMEKECQIVLHYLLDNKSNMAIFSCTCFHKKPWCQSTLVYTKMIIFFCKQDIFDTLYLVN